MRNIRAKDRNVLRPSLTASIMTEYKVCYTVDDQGYFVIFVSAKSERQARKLATEQIRPMYIGFPKIKIGPVYVK